MNATETHLERCWNAPAAHRGSGRGYLNRLKYQRDAIATLIITLLIAGAVMPVCLLLSAIGWMHGMGPSKSRRLEATSGGVRG